MYRKGVKVLVKDPETQNLIHVQDVNETEKYIADTYDLEVTTLPKVVYRRQEIEEGKTKRITVAEPGLINLSSTAPIYGSIYQLTGNREVWVINLASSERVTTLTLQPGRYKIAFRTQETYGSKYTAIRNFTITSGKSTTINLNNKI